MRPVPRWKLTLAQTLADHRQQLIEHAGVYTSDENEAARSVDRALVEVFARRRGVTDAATADARCRIELRGAFGRAARRSGRGAGTGSDPEAPVPTSGPEAPGGDPPALAMAVRRRRARWFGAVAAVTAGALVLGVGAVMAVGRLAEPDSAGVADEPVVQTPEATQSPEPQALGPVTVDPLLPAAEPLLEGMLEAAGPGWSIVQYRNEAVSGCIFYLVSPEGDRYEIPTPLAGVDRSVGGLHDWLRGSRLVLLGRNTRDGAEFDVVDILTGDRYFTLHWGLADEPGGWYYLTAEFAEDGSTDLLASWRGNAYEPPSQVALTVRLTVDGQEVARIPEYRGTDSSNSSWALSPDGTQLALNEYGRLHVVRAADFAEVAAITTPYPDHPGDCQVGQWWSPDEVLLRCSGADGVGQEVWIAPVGGGAPAELASSQYWLEVWRVGGQAVVRGVDESWLAVRVLQADGTLAAGAVEVPEIVTAVARGRLYAYNPAYDGPYWDNALVAVDPFSGSTVELFPAHGDYDLIASVVTHSNRG